MKSKLKKSAPNEGFFIWRSLWRLQLYCLVMRHIFIKRYINISGGGVE